MPTWNEVHYARAQEFTRLLADALAAASAPSPKPAAPTPPPVAAKPASAPAAPPAGPTAATVLGKIPWGKK